MRKKQDLLMKKQTNKTKLNLESFAGFPLFASFPFSLYFVCCVAYRVNVAEP